MPLLHIELSSEESDFVWNVFKFTSWQSFFFAIGWPVCILGFATVGLVIRKFIVEDRIKKAMTIICCGFMFLSFFFLIWAFHPSLPKDFDKVWYRINSVLIGIVFTIGYFFIVTFLEKTNLRYKNYFSKIMEFVIVDIQKKHIDESRRKEYVEDYLTEVEKL